MDDKLWPTSAGLSFPRKIINREGTAQDPTTCSTSGVAQSHGNIVKAQEKRCAWKEDHVYAFKGVDVQLRRHMGVPCRARSIGHSRFLFLLTLALALALTV